MPCLSYCIQYNVNNNNDNNDHNNNNSFVFWGFFIFNFVVFWFICLF